MDATKYEAIQKQIEYILLNRFSPEQIADNYLNIPFDKRPFHSDVETEGKNRIAKNRKLSSWLNNRTEPEQLINEIIRAVSFYEIPVICEHSRGKKGSITVKEIDEHLAQHGRNLERVKLDLAALCRVIETQPLSHTTTIELHARRILLQEVVEQGYVYISRQQEVALKGLSDRHAEALSLIRDFVLAREPNQPEQTYTRALVLIVFRLLQAHAHGKQKAVGVNTTLTVSAITAISPNLKKYVEEGTVKAARTQGKTNN